MHPGPWSVHTGDLFYLEEAFRFLNLLSLNDGTFALVAAMPERTENPAE
jgi:hypothetical protein